MLSPAQMQYYTEPIPGLAVSGYAGLGGDVGDDGGDLDIGVGMAMTTDGVDSRHVGYAQSSPPAASSSSSAAAAASLPSQSVPPPRRPWA